MEMGGEGSQGKERRKLTHVAQMLDQTSKLSFQRPLLFMSIIVFPCFHVKNIITVVKTLFG